MKFRVLRTKLHKWVGYNIWVLSKNMIKWQKQSMHCFSPFNAFLSGGKDFKNINRSTQWHSTWDKLPIYTLQIHNLSISSARCQRGQTEVWDWQILHLTNIKGSSSELCSLSYPKDKVWWMRCSEILRGRSVSEDSRSSDPKPCPFRRNKSTACFSIQ